MTTTCGTRRHDVMVTRHAVAQAAKRRAYRDPRSNRPITGWDRLAELIAADVADALESGRRMNHKPDGFRLWRERRRQLRPGEWFVHSDNMSRGFIVKNDDRNVWWVVTVLTRAGGGA